MAKILNKKYRVFMPATGNLSDPLFDYAESTTYHYNDNAEEFDKVSEVVTEIVDNGEFDVPTLPVVGTPVSIGELYTDSGQVYRVRQSHNVTAYDPDDIPDLFTVYRKETGDMPWIKGEKVDVGVIRTEDGVKYECLQAHQTETGWEPSTTLALWKVYEEPGGDIPVWEQPGSTNPYMIGDQVYFPTVNDSIYESVINNNVWSPTTYPAGWKLIS